MNFSARLRRIVTLLPVLVIAILVMAFNFIGDGLRDLLDPRLRK